MRVLAAAGLARCHHVGLQQGTFQEDVVVGQRLVLESQHLLRHLLGRFQVVLAVWQHLRLHDWHQAVLLADGGVAGQDVGVLHHGLVGRGVPGDLQHAAPFGEVGAGFLVLGAPVGQSVQTLRSALVVAAGQRHHALVHLDARDDPLALQNVHEQFPGAVLLVQGLVKQDHPGDVLLQGVAACEENLAILASVFLRVFQADAFQTLAHGAYGLIGCQDALSGCYDAIRDASQLLFSFFGQILGILRHDEAVEERGDNSVRRRSHRDKPKTCQTARDAPGCDDTSAPQNDVMLFSCSVLGRMFSSVWMSCFLGMSEQLLVRLTK